MLSVCHYFTTSDCQAVALPLFHSSQAFSSFLLRPVRLSSLFLFPSAVATSSSLSGFSVCSCTSFFCLFHLKPSTPSSFSFFKHFLPSFNAFLPLLYLCRSLFLLWLSLSLLCLFPFDLPPNDSRLLFVHFRAWIWVCVQAHTCTSQFESVNDCPLRVQHAVYRASRFLSRTCCMIITLCSPDVFVTIHHFAFFIIIFFLFPTCFFIIIFVCLRAYGSNTLPYLTYICALVFLCVTVPVGSCILYFVSEAKPSRAAHEGTFRKCCWAKKTTLSVVCAFVLSLLVAYGIVRLLQRGCFFKNSTLKTLFCFARTPQMNNLDLSG